MSVSIISWVLLFTPIIAIFEFDFLWQSEERLGWPEYIINLGNGKKCDSYSCLLFWKKDILFLDYQFSIDAMIFDEDVSNGGKSCMDLFNL